MTSPSSPLRTLGRRLQVDGSIHANAAEEFDKTDAAGFQGGQAYNAATATPSQAPSASPTGAPTSAPTSHPTIGGVQWYVKGVAWYDRNANGVRDSNVAVNAMGSDVEFSHGLGGVGLQLVQCDKDTGRAYVPPAGETLDSFAAGRTAGVDAQGKARIGPMIGSNGKFEIHLAQGHGLERHYYLQAQVPSNADTPFFFTDGICNDDEPGWECTYPDSPPPPAVLAANATARPLGIRAGRSPGCVFVDKDGDVDRLVNFGVAREGDTREVGTDVSLVLQFDAAGPAVAGDRGLAGVLARAAVLPGGRRGAARYLLADQDKVAIGTVTAEVLAAALDARLEAHDVELDSVHPRDVVFSPGAGGDRLAVAMEIRGHYSPPPDLDFDYMVQDSINRDTTAIRRGLREFNRNCRSQTTKVRDKGYGADDFDAVVSTSGARRGRTADLAAMDDVFSTACATDLRVPDYFETSLQEVGARDAKDPFGGRGAVVYVAHDEDQLLQDWAVGPVAGLAGLIMLLAGLFVFRRVLGTRRGAFADRTKDVDGDEARRFGEEGGAVDDGSVGSAFYSESDSDPEETDKERRMRLKRKEKANEQQPRRHSRLYKDERGAQDSLDGDIRKPRRKNGAVRRTLASSMRKSVTKSLTKKKPRRSAYGRGEGRPLAVSQGSDDTGDDLSGSAREREEAAMKRGYRGDDGKRGAGRTGRNEGSVRAHGDGSKPRRKNGAARRTLVASAKKSFTRSPTKATTKARRDEEGQLLAASRDSDTSEDRSGSAREREEAAMKRGYRGDDRKPAARKASSSSDEKTDRSERRARGRSSRRGGDNANALNDSTIV